MEKNMSESKVVLSILVVVGAIVIVGMMNDFLEDQKQTEVKLEMIKSGANPLEVGCAFIDRLNHDFCMRLLEDKKK